MVVGSWASSFHGEPRTTMDVDLVVDPSAESLRRFVDSLPPDRYYADDNAALEAFRRRASFNVVDRETGWKVDLMVRRDRAFSRVEFDRRLPVPELGPNVAVATAEDTIIAKLEWAREGESERQLRDVSRILAVSGDDLDLEYLNNWIKRLDLDQVWSTARELAGLNRDI
jgi:hypothetical protein